ncbi:MAG TPA: leucine-rich repeat domain-containing protein [Acholeplasmataceae bacterium]|nr:leucine-rich repeat domain-containing protein [Acholeplasmataceae bacterium]
MAKDLNNILLSQEEENKIKAKTPDKLPLNPTAQGWSGQEVRRFLTKSLTDNEGSFLAEFKKKMIEIKTQFEDVFGEVAETVDKVNYLEQKVEEVRYSEKVDPNAKAYFNYAGSIYGDKYSLLPNAWESSLAVDPLEISVNSSYDRPRGTAQYPNGETEGVIIPQGVTSIGSYAFYNWGVNNQPLVIPNSVTTIGRSAFGVWQANNQPLVIPDSVTSIEQYAFYLWQSNNQPLVIPDSVTSIGSNSFSGWYLVPYIEIQAITPPTLASSDAFNNQNDAPIYVPNNSVEAYKTATNWVNLASRIFPISDNLTDLIGVVNDVIYQSDTHIMTFKRIEKPDIVIDLPSGNSYEPDGVTVVLNEEDKLKVSEKLEIDGGFL